MAAVISKTGTFSALDHTVVVHHHGVEQRFAQNSLNVKNQNENGFPELIQYAALVAVAYGIAGPGALRLIRDQCEALIGDQQSVESTRGFQLGTTV